VHSNRKNLLERTIPAKATQIVRSNRKDVLEPTTQIVRSNRKDVLEPKTTQIVRSNMSARAARHHA
jgi:hypothetical protein